METVQNQIISALKKTKSVRSTYKQIEIVKEICNNPDFGDPTLLWQKIYKKNGLSIATIYRTIGILVDLGFVRKEKQKMGYTYYLNAFTDQSSSVEAHQG